MNGHGEEEQQIAFEIYVVVAKRNVEEEEENCDCIEFLMKELRNVGRRAVLLMHLLPFFPLICSGKSKKKSLLPRDAQFDGPRLSPWAPPASNCSSRSPPRGSPISTLAVPIKALEVTDVVSLTKTLDSVNSVVPGASSVFGAERQALDGCHGFLASNNMNFTQRTLVVASP
ncbi:hypothetical protein NC652_002100 [Populus alba x Populus x berolinensis]|nr:hypothetical protein NC652_002100 [Populus alba x Populus x berolinensis]